MIFFKKNKKGFTLIEALLTIALAIIIIMAFVFIIYNRVSSNVKINNEINNILKIKGMIDSSFAGASDYTGISYTMFSWPDNMYDTSRFTISNGVKSYYVINSWGGRIILSTYNNSSYYSIAYYQVPVEACYKIVTYFTNMKNFATMGVYNTTAYTLTYDKTNIDSLCTDDKFKSSQGVMLFSSWGSASNS